MTTTNTDLEKPSPEPGTSTSKPPQCPEGSRPGWLAVLGCFAVMFCTFGYTNAFGVYQAYYKDHFLSDYSEFDIAWIGSLQIFFMMGTGLITGPLSDRYGPKVILYPCTTLFVVSIMLNSLCKRYYQFILAQGVLGGIANGATYTPAVAVIGHYFQRRRPLAIGIASSGSSLGGVIYPIMLDRLLNQSSLGFGWSVRAVGFLTLGLCIITCVSIYPNAPPRYGSLFLAEAWRKPEYVLHIIAMFLAWFGILVPFFYLPSFAQFHGIEVNYSFYLVSILNGPSLFGRILAGALSNRLGRFNVLTFCTAVSGILLLCWLRIHSKGSLTVFCALYGFFSGSVIGLFPTTIAIIAPQPNQIGMYVGMALGVFSISGLTGAPITGTMIAHYGEYKQAIIFAGVVTLASAGFLVATKVAYAGKKLIA